jgi:hypothetical protein
LNSSSAEISECEKFLFELEKELCETPKSLYDEFADKLNLPGSCLLLLLSNIMPSSVNSPVISTRFVDGNRIKKAWNDLIQKNASLIF